MSARRWLFPLAMFAAGFATASAADDGDDCITNTTLTKSEEQILNIGTTVASSMSVLGSSFIIFTYFKFPKLRTMAYRLVLMLSIADVLFAMSYLFGATYEGGNDECSTSFSCYFESLTLQVFGVATLLWTCCLAFHVYGVLVNKWGRVRIERLEKYYHFICWGTAILSGVALASVDVIGHAGLWCWIPSDYPLARLAFWYGPLFVIILYNIVVYWRVSVALGDFATAEVKDKIVGRLRLYVLVFLILHIPAVINRVQNYIAPDSPVFILGALQACIEPQQGFWNAVVYGLNKKVLQEYKRLRCCRKARGGGSGGLEMEEDFDVSSSK